VAARVSFRDKRTFKSREDLGAAKMGNGSLGFGFG